MTALNVMAAGVCYSADIKSDAVITTEKLLRNCETLREIETYLPRLAKFR